RFAHIHVCQLFPSICEGNNKQPTTTTTTALAMTRWGTAGQDKERVHGWAKGTLHELAPARLIPATIGNTQRSNIRQSASRGFTPKGKQGRVADPPKTLYNSLDNISNT
ncbi:unnamed protein product, partial [Ectocarpus sp. 12 AP-2014]